VEGVGWILAIVNSLALLVKEVFRFDYPSKSPPISNRYRLFSI